MILPTNSWAISHAQPGHHHVRSLEGHSLGHFLLRHLGSLCRRFACRLFVSDIRFVTDQLGVRVLKLSGQFVCALLHHRRSGVVLADSRQQIRVAVEGLGIVRIHSKKYSKCLFCFIVIFSDFVENLGINVQGLDGSIVLNECEMWVAYHSQRSIVKWIPPHGAARDSELFSAYLRPCRTFRVLIKSARNCSMCRDHSDPAKMYSDISDTGLLLVI